MGAGRQVTDTQVKEVRLNLNKGGSLLMAAMKAGMDRKTARKYRDRGQLPSEAQTPHTWRTRPDPLLEVWPASRSYWSVSRLCRPRRWWSGCSGNIPARTGNGNGAPWNGACGSGRPSTGRPRKCFSARYMSQVGWARRTSRTWKA